MGKGDEQTEKDTFTKSIKEAYFTAKEAYGYLGLDRDTFNNFVRRNPNEFGQTHILGKHGYYRKDNIRAFKEKMEALLLTSRTPLFEFRPAQMKDLEQEDHLAYLNFGEGSLSSERVSSRRRFLKANPYSSFHLYDNGKLIACLNLVPMRHDAILEFREGKRGWMFPDDAIEQFAPGERLECIIIDFATITNAPPEKRDRYAAYLLHSVCGIQLVEWAKQGVDIKSIDACGGTLEGKKLLEQAGFTFRGTFKTPAINTPKIMVDRDMYYLDIDQSDLTLLQRYKRTLEEWKSTH